MELRAYTNQGGAFTLEFVSGDNTTLEVKIVSRDTNWEVIVVLCYNEGGKASPFIVIIKALWRGLQQCAEIGLSEVTSFKEMQRKSLIK